MACRRFAAVVVSVDAMFLPYLHLGFPISIVTQLMYHYIQQR